jgi:hypothetical protein
VDEDTGQLLPNKDEQNAIKEMVSMRRDKKPLRVIAEEMRAKGFRISHEGVAGVLRAALGESSS